MQIIPPKKCTQKPNTKTDFNHVTSGPLSGAISLTPVQDNLLFTSV